MTGRVCDTVSGKILNEFAHFEHLPQSVVVTEAALSPPGPRIIYINRAFERLTKWSRDEILGLTPRVLQGQETDRTLLRSLRKTLERGEAWSGETVNYRRDGTSFVLSWSVAPARDEGGRIVRYVAVQEDVTEARRRERQRSRLDRLVDRMLAVVSEGIVLTDERQNIVRFSRGAETIFGYGEQEILGAPLSVLIPERFRDAHHAHVRTFAAGDGHARPMSERVEVTGLRRDGKEFPARIAIARVGDTGFIAIVRDLTHDRRQETHMREAQRIAGLGFWVWGIEDGSLEWSEEIYRIFGLSPDTFTPRYETFLQTVHEEDRDSVLDAVDAALKYDGLQSRAPYAVVHRIVRGDGEVRWVREEGKVERAHDGRPRTMIGVVQDITEQKLAEMRILDAQHRAEAANEAKSRFLATMSHELRTPLNAVIGFSDLIASEAVGRIAPKVYGDYIEHIRKGGRQLLGLVEDILEATSIENGAMRYEPETVRSADLREAVAEMTWSQAMLCDVDVEFGDWPHLALHIDPRLVRQALVNLIGNAIKFSPKGGRVTVEAKMRASGEPAFSVRDHGPGIPADRLEEVVLPFTQVDDDLARRFEGVGLGLYLTKSFLARHGGTLEIASPVEGGGTLATAVLPAACVVEGI